MILRHYRYLLNGTVVVDRGAVDDSRSDDLSTRSLLLQRLRLLWRVALVIP
jgi:hypothetical protein